MREDGIEPVTAGHRARWRRRAAAFVQVATHPQALAAAGILLGSVVLARVGPAAWGETMRVVGLPACLSYSDVYMYAGGAFQRRGEDWVEVPTYRGLDVSYFDEVERDTDFIYLVNAAARSNTKVDTIRIRLPVCGGVSQVSVASASNWIDSHLVWR